MRDLDLQTDESDEEHNGSDTQRPTKKQKNGSAPTGGDNNAAQPSPEPPVPLDPLLEVLGVDACTY